MNKRKSYVILVVVSTLFISYLHYSTIPENHELHNIYAELYYIPLLIGALLFGMRGAFLTYLFVSFLYLPYIFIEPGELLVKADRILHLIFSGIFALTAGFLVDRIKKHQMRQERDRYLAGLGRAASALVHDLKNPIITVTGFARRIRDGKGDSKTSSQTIIDEAQKMDAIVHTVLDFAKPIRLDMRQVSISDVINRAIETCGVKCEEKRLSIDKKLPDREVSAMLDGFYFERALVNLIQNAIDASHEQDKINIACSFNGHSLSIIIKDYGTGIDKETLDNIFIPFFSTKQSGTGLGMSIAKKIIEEHDGSIDITSQPDRGAKIRIILPQSALMINHSKDKRVVAEKHVKQ